MDVFTGSAAVFPIVFKYAKNDLKKRYALLDFWALPELKKELPAFENRYFLIDGKTIFVLPFNNSIKRVCDGCTLVPEKCIIDTVIGSILHDPWYDSISEIAKAWGWTEREVRVLGDIIFASILLRLARERKTWVERKAAIAVAHTYFWGVRLFGGTARAVYRYLAILAISAMIVMPGCINDVFEPDSPLDKPNYIEEKAGK